MILNNPIIVTVGNQKENFTDPKEFLEFIIKVEELNTKVPTDNHNYQSSISGIKSRLEQFFKNNKDQSEEALEKAFEAQRNTILDNNNQLQHLQSVLSPNSERGMALSALIESHPKESSNFFKGCDAYYQGTGLQKADNRDYVRGYFSGVVNENTTPNESKSILDKVAKEYDKQHNSFKDKIVELKKEIETVKKENQDLRTSFKTEWEQIKNKHESSLKEVVDTSKKEIKTYQDSLEEQTSLKSATNYWWRRAGFAFGILSITGLFLLTLPFSANKILIEVFGVTLPDAIKFLVNLDFKDHSPYGVSAVCIFSTLLLFYLISTSVKIMINQLNIINQSMDKITKTRYFLSLMKNEKNIIKPEDRQYMLKAIFEEKPDAIAAGNIGDGTPASGLIKNK